MKKSTVRRWEAAGAVFAILSGSLLHFVFEWSGRIPLVAPFAAVNESVWEHLKLAFWPIVVWGLVEAFVSGIPRAALPVAKAVAAYLAPALIVAAFYGYEAITGSHSLLVDILIFILAVIAAQWVSARILLRHRPSPAARRLSLAALALLALAFALFTFAPPRLPIFLDPVTGGYGI